jgi:glyoxylate utilization-related uncharacterized protein
MAGSAIGLHKAKYFAGKLSVTHSNCRCHLSGGSDRAYETGIREVIIHQQVWVRKGAIEVTVGKITYRLTDDDCLAMQMNEPVTFRNRTRKAAQYIVALTNGRAR